MNTGIVPMEDIDYLVQQNTGKLNMVLAGMATLMADTDNKVSMLENQTWYQRMSRTISGKNKITQREIQQNHDKINMYMVQAMTELFNQNCIDHQIILSLGNRLNEIYEDHIQLKQMLGLFVSKLNEKIESIDNFHMLSTEINQKVYSNEIPVIAVSKIVSQLDIRTVNDNRKMDILFRAMRDAGIINTEEVFLSDLLSGFLDITEEDAGIFILFYNNMKSDYISEIISDILMEYYSMPQKTRKMKNHKAFVKKILSDRQVELDYKISLEELYLLLIEAYSDNVVQNTIEIETYVNNDELKEAEQAILDYEIDNALEILQDFITDNGRAMYLAALCYEYNTDLDDEYEKDDIIEELLENGYKKGEPLVAVKYAFDCLYYDEEDEREKEDIYNKYMYKVKNMAENGDIFAEYEYGYLLLRNAEDYNDEKEGASWLKKSADKGFWLAEIRLGECYEGGEGVEKNERKAFKYYKKAYQFGVPEAMNLLADCYYYGNGTEENEEKALDIYEEYFRIYENNLLSIWTYDNDDSYINTDDIQEQILKIPNLKDIGYNLGMCYLSKVDNLEEDIFEYLEAIRYFKYSADLNNPYACYELALYYYNLYCNDESDLVINLDLEVDDYLEEASDYLDKADQYANEEDVDLSLKITKLYAEIFQAEISLWKDEF